MQQPKWKFILTYGLSWATLVFLFTTVASFLFNFQTEIWQSGKGIAVSVLGWAAGGIVYGIFLRSVIEKQYRKLKVKQGASSSKSSTL